MFKPMQRLRLRLLHPLLLVLLLLLLSLVAVKAQGNFEDADKANDYTDQHFDLRHTIPGEPGIDYPILSEVPKTSFVCKDRHEGYYADVESRCQAFRICAHTARSVQGFGFLCPNGTVFSQQKFVCDWYRNVDCDASERFYDMNREHTVGNTQQMMERVRQMMEYPTMTISKALQDAPQQHQKTPHAHQTLSKDLSNLSGVLNQPATASSGKSVLRGEAIKSEALPAPKTAATGDNDDGIYVNSLGELSSDPGIQFDHTNAHIIAEYPREIHLQKQKNFAEHVNTGLETLREAPAAAGEHIEPDYMKHIRNTKEEATQLDFVSNINNLLEEVSTDLDPSVSGYHIMSPTSHKLKQPFRFLSRGFASEANKDQNGSKSSSGSSYVYNRPQQHSGPLRYTPNEIPSDAHKASEHKLKLSDDKTTISSTTEGAEAIVESFEPLYIAPTLPPFENEETATIAATSSSTLTTRATTISTTAEPTNAGQTYGSEVAIIESIGQAAALTASHMLSEGLQQIEEVPLSGANAEKVDVDLQAEKLLLAGVKQTSHDDQSVLTHSRQASTSSSTTSTTVPPRTTPAMSTSTETVTEISSTQERIRSYRRFAHKRVGGSNGTVKRLTTPTTAKITTTEGTIPTTRSYLDRLAASRSRLSRLSLATKPTKRKATTTTTTAKPSRSTVTTTAAATPRTTTIETPLTVLHAGDETGPNKKLSVRNIEREVAQPKANWDSVQNNLQRFQVQRGNRVYTPATRASISSTSSGSSTSSTSFSRGTTSSTSTTTRPIAAASVQRGRNRHANYKTQAPQQRTRGTTTPRSTTTVATTTTAASPPSQRTTSSVLSTLTQQISALASGYTYTAAPLDPTPYSHTHNRNTPALVQTQTVSNTQQQQPQQSPQSPQSQQIQTTSSLSTSSAFLPFDKLTRAIVDESILQNYKSTHTQRVTNTNSYQVPAATSTKQQPQPQRTAKPTRARTSNYASNNYNYQKPATATAAATAAAAAAAAVAAPALASLTIPQRPQQQQLPQLPQVLLPTQPGITIARAEGQRITPDATGSIISSLINQPQPTSSQTPPYVALSDFLNNKFGQPSSSSSSSSSSSPSLNAAGPSTLQQQHKPKILQQQLPQQQQLAQQQQQIYHQQQQHQNVQQQQQQQQHHLNYIAQRYLPQPPKQQQQYQHQQPQQQHNRQQHHLQQHHLQQQYPPHRQQHQQQQQQHHQQQQDLHQTQQYQTPQRQQQQAQQQINYQQQPYQQLQQFHQQQSQRPSIQSIQQPYLTPNIFVPYQQQQQLLPLFPPLAAGVGTQSAAQPQTAQVVTGRSSGHQADHLNVQLPALPNGLIPAPVLQVAQKRIDVKFNPNQFTSKNRRTSLDQGQEVAFYAGRTSYQVPQSSVGRLPNDITQLLRQRQRRY